VAVSEGFACATGGSNTTHLIRSVVGDDPPTCAVSWVLVGYTVAKSYATGMGVRQFVDRLVDPWIEINCRLLR